MRTIVVKNRVWSFLILNYLISWTFLYPSYRIIEEAGTITPLALIGIFGAYGPSISAIIIQAIVDKKGVRGLLKKLIQIRTTIPTLLFIAIVPILLYVISQWIASVFFLVPSEPNLLLGFTYLPFWVLVALPTGPMGEELGWRGFMLPELLKRHSLIKSTVLVGLAWGIWHMASFTFPGAAIPDFLEVTIGTILLFIANTIALSFIYTYVYLKSRGSVFYAILLHALFNAASNISADFLGAPDQESVLIGAYLINILLAFVVGLFLIYRHQKK